MEIKNRGFLDPRFFLRRDFHFPVSKHAADDSPGRARFHRICERGSAEQSLRSITLAHGLTVSTGDGRPPGSGV